MNKSSSDIDLIEEGVGGFSAENPPTPPSVVESSCTEFVSNTIGASFFATSIDAASTRQRNLSTPSSISLFNNESSQIAGASHQSDSYSPQHDNPADQNVNLIMLVSEMLRNADASMKETSRSGESVLNASRRRTFVEEDGSGGAENESQSFSPSFGADEESVDSRSIKKRGSSIKNTGRPSSVRQNSLQKISIAEESDRFGETTSEQFVLSGGGLNKPRLRDMLPPEADPFAIREGMTLSWKDVNFTVKGFGNKPERQILSNVWGEVPKKETTAIMGGSGAGKSSLLNILAGRTKSGGNIDVKANIRLDNMPADPTKIEIRQMIAFVAQDDSLQVTATPREAIRFSAKLRLGRSMTDEQLDLMTDCMLEELGLAGCADTIVGGPLIKGISGGERKRTSVGVELVVKPAMVFLDEPTSGLDSFSAVQLCHLLKKVARAGASVMFTIHQPSSRIFREFDHLILLNKGRVMYQGPVNYVADFFGARGQPCPRNYNPADWVMKVAQKNSVEDLLRAGFFPEDDRKDLDPTQMNGEEAFSIRNQSLVLNNDKTASTSTEIYMLVAREVKHISRAKSVTMARIIQTLVLATVIGLIFFQIGGLPVNSLSTLQGQFGGIVMVATIIMMGPAQAALLSFPDERPVFLREYTTKHYSVTSYFLSRLAIEAIMGAIQTAVTVSVCYFMIDFKGNFTIFYEACFTLAMGSTAIAVIMGAAAGSSSKIATATLPLVLLPQMLFVGYFVAPQLIPSWLRWLQYICPMTYATRILLVDEFYQCQVESDSFIERIYCEQLLATVGADNEEVWWYWLILAAQFVVFRCLALVILYRSAQKFY